uniref:Uncharacterized protein n=1 Tax=Tanacetum cinerariifolium TaxID=118510 RepID=A0A6L2MUZ0_TANCI|nr:hypothetical protein [Tanacetum cinerariifolium]
MTDYSLWEVFLNGDSSAPTRVIEGVVQPIAPTTAEQRLARNNELKARGTLLMALPDKHQLKFNIHKDAKTLIDVASISTASAKIPIYALPNVDTLSNAVIYSFFASQSNSPQLDNDDLKQIDKTGRNLGANGPTSMRFDMSKVECYNRHRKGHFTWECSVMVWATMIRAFRQKKNQPTMPSWHSPLQVLIMRNIYATKPDLVFHDAPNDETDHTAVNVELSPSKPDNDLSHTHRPSIPIIEDWVTDSEDDSEAEILHSTPSLIQPTKQVKTPRSYVKTIETSVPAANHKTVIPKPKSNGNSRNRKACFVCKSLTHLIKDYDYYNKKVAQTPTRNHA